MKKSTKTRRRKPMPRRAPANTPPPSDVEPLFEPEALAAVHANPELADTTVIGRDVDATRIETPVATDETIEKALEHEREAFADAHHLVDKLGGAPEPAANKKLAAEKAREGDPTIDRHAGKRVIDAAYRHEVVARANELQHELEHHLESEALDREERPLSNERRHATEEPENKRAKISEVEPVPTTSDELHRERALFAGGAVWVVGGLAAVVLGILAVAGVARPFVFVEIAFLVTGVSILVSSLANGARLFARREVREQEEDEARDVDEAMPPALHARASDRRVELHR